MTTCTLPTSLDLESLKSFRKAKGMTQEEVAKAAGLSTKGFRMIESGKTRNPGIETVGMICDAIGIHIYQVLIADRPELPAPPEPPGS